MKYAKIVNEETKQCDVGVGNDSQFYKLLGMELMDVEQGYDGQWYLSGYTPKKSEKEIQRDYTKLIQSILDTEAQKLGYDNCLSVCSYMDTGVQKFDDEGTCFRKWRSAVWNKGYELLDKVTSGEMEIPSEEELIEMLPNLELIYSE